MNFNETAYDSISVSEASTLHAPRDSEPPESDKTELISAVRHNVPSVVVRKTRSLSILQWGVHFTSVAFTVLILLLCWRNVYFSDLTRPNVNTQLNAFQFVARLHEIIVNGSLIAITLYHLRYELCEADGIPLGYLTAPFQLQMPAMLFTWEFWSATTSRSGKTRRLWFCCLILLATIITALVGPASAILLLPQLDWWDVSHPFDQTGGFTYFNSSYEDQWPTTFTNASIPSYCTPLYDAYDCPFDNIDGLYKWADDYHSQWILPNMTVANQADTLRYLSSSNNSNGHLGYTVSSTTMSGITRDMGTMWLYAKRIGLKIADLGRPILFMEPPDQKPILKPLVQAQCGMPYDITKSDVIDIAFVSDQLKYTSSETPLPRQINAKINLTSYRQNYSSDNVDVPPRIGFFNITSAANTGRQVFGAVAAATYANANAIFPGDSNYNASSYARVAFPCLFAFHWVPTSVSYDPLVDNIVIVDKPDPAAFTSGASLASGAIPVDVDITYAQRLNSVIPDYGTTRVLEYIFSGQKTWGNYIYDGDWIDRWSWLISTIHSLQFADGLARIQHYLPLFVWHSKSGNLTQFTTDLADLNDVYYRNNRSDPYDNNHFGNEDAITSHPELYNPVYWRVERFGYAWSLGKHTTKSLALVVVLLHTVLVLYHIGMVWWRNWRCYAWSTPLELMILALRSPREPSEAVLKGAASGVEDRRTFGDVVRIREGERDGSVMLVVERNDSMHVESGASTAYAGHELGSFDSEGQVRTRGRLKPDVKYL